MTENNTTATEAADIQQATDGEQQPTEPQDNDTPNSEAARYRRQLRDTEATLSTATTRLTNYQRRAAEAAIADVVATPGDLFDVGQVNLADFIDDETGDVRTDELTQAAQAFVAARPQLGASYSPPMRFEHGPIGAPVHDGPSWAKALAPERRNQ